VIGGQKVKGYPGAHDVPDDGGRGVRLDGVLTGVGERDPVLGVQQGRPGRERERRLEGGRREGRKEKEGGRRGGGEGGRGGGGEGDKTRDVDGVYI